MRRVRAGALGADEWSAGLAANSAACDRCASRAHGHNLSGAQPVRAVHHHVLARLAGRSSRMVTCPSAKATFTG